MSGKTHRAPGTGPELVLAWDTCTPEGTIAVGEGGTLLSESGFRAEKGHTWWLMPRVASVLERLGAGPGDLCALAVGTGPGGFTGVKVGVTTAKAVALALDIPLFGASTLDVLAAGAPRTEGTVLAVIDARRGMAYCAAYRWVDGTVPERLTDYACLLPGEAARAVRGLGERPALVVGDIIEGLVPALGDMGLEVEDALKRTPRAGDLLALAWRALSPGGMGAGDAASVLPVYLRSPV